MENNPKQILIYGTKWCPDSRRSQFYLKRKKIEYIFIDIDKDESASQKVIEINKGNRSVPTIIFPDGSVLVEPTNKELEKKIQEL